MSTNFIDHLQDGDHASRPAAGDVPQGTLYACTTHNIIYQSDGVSVWSNWWVGTGASDILDIPTAETDDTLVLAPDGAGGVEFRAEAGGGGGLSQSYVGYNTIGGTAVGVTTLEVNVQKITLANDCLVTDVEVYIKNNSAANPLTIVLGLWSDNAGKPKTLLSAGSPHGGNPLNLYRVSATAGDARWLGWSPGRWCAAGDYWVGWQMRSDASKHDFYYDATGSGYKWSTGGNDFLTDAPDTSGTVYTLSSVSRTYSIRANTIR